MDWEREMWREAGGRDYRGHKEVLRGDGYVCYHDCDKYICQNLSNGILYVNYTSIKLLEKEGTQHYETKKRQNKKKWVWKRTN